MARGLSGRHYLTFDTDEPNSEDFIKDNGRDCVRAAVKRFGWSGDEDEVLQTPSRWNAVFRGPDGMVIHAHPVRKKISSVIFKQPPDSAFLEAINSGQHKEVNGLAAIGADLPIHVADYWNPAESLDPFFATRQRAHALMGIAKTQKTGSGANVIIVDQGLDMKYIEHLRNGAFAGGWHMGGTPLPGKYPFGHGSMLARNILAVAPDAALFDAPIIPDEIGETEKFISTVHAAFNQIVRSINCLKATGEPSWQRPWVFVNAWATFNRGLEHPRGHYSANVEHKFNQMITEMAAEHDLVFAAGNCGQFCPSRRCGIDDVGPEHSIIGANSHPDVLTVGAVRADGMWLGYSSQGPGMLFARKPDLCAASQFCEDDDAGMTNTGTSAACAIAAGIVAALRSKYGRTKKLNSKAIKDILTKSATHQPEPVKGRPWDGRLGYGIINLTEACKRVK